MVMGWQNYNLINSCSILFILSRSACLRVRMTVQAGWWSCREIHCVTSHLWAPPKSRGGGHCRGKKETELFMSGAWKMKTLAPCQSLGVTDGCISVRESQMQRRSDVLHVDKAAKYEVYITIGWLYFIGVASLFVSMYTLSSLSETVMLE